jgi:prevent-host-death family protein
MKSATVRRLRHDFGTVLNWVEEGEPVQISKRGKIVALLTPPPPPKLKRLKKRPNFVARFKRTYGNKKLSGNIIIEERESRDY